MVPYVPGRCNAKSNVFELRIFYCFTKDLWLVASLSLESQTPILEPDTLALIAQQQPLPQIGSL